VVALGVFGHPWFREAITHTVWGVLSCKSNSFSEKTPCGLYLRTVCIVVMSLGIVRLFGAIDVNNPKMLWLAALSYVVEATMFGLELAMGSYSLKVSWAECSKYGTSACDLRTVIPAQIICLVSFLLIVNQIRVLGTTNSRKAKKL